MQQNQLKTRAEVPTPPSGCRTQFFDADNSGKFTAKNSDGTFDIIENESSGVDELSELSDTEISKPTTGQVLQMNAKGKWVNANPSSGSTPTKTIDLFGLTDGNKFYDTISQNIVKGGINTGSEGALPNGIVKLEFRKYDPAFTYNTHDVVCPSQLEYERGAMFNYYESLVDNNTVNSLTDQTKWSGYNVLNINSVNVQGEVTIKPIATVFGYERVDENNNVIAGGVPYYLPNKIKFIASDTMRTPNGKDLILRGFANDNGDTSTDFNENLLPSASEFIKLVLDENIGDNSNLNNYFKSNTTAFSKMSFVDDLGYKITVQPEIGYVTNDEEGIHLIEIEAEVTTNGESNSNGYAAAGISVSATATLFWFDISNSSWHKTSLGTSDDLTWSYDVNGQPISTTNAFIVIQNNNDGSIVASTSQFSISEE